jgi:hypothetical protein
MPKTKKIDQAEQVEPKEIEVKENGPVENRDFSELIKQIEPEYQLDW